MAGPSPRLTATETAADTSGIRSTAVIAAPVIMPAQATAAPVIAAPVSAPPAIEASSQPSGGSGADVRGPGEPGATTRHPERSQEGVRRRGIVKWFSASKGYGFVRGDDGEDAFVHVSAVASAGLRTLIQGQAVEYELRRNAKGLHAVSLTLPDPVALRSA
jgi:CspA family cold shock protein